MNKSRMVSCKLEAKILLKQPTPIINYYRLTTEMNMKWKGK